MSHRQIMLSLSGLMVGMFIAAIDQTIVATALPAIVTDLGGRLTARNGEGGGAVFEMQLPILGNKQEAAE